MSSTGNTNPGNFANRPHEEVVEIAKRGGQASHTGGSASTDPEKEVISSIASSSNISRGSRLMKMLYRTKSHPWTGKPRTATPTPATSPTVLTKKWWKLPRKEDRLVTQAGMPRAATPTPSTRTPATSPTVLTKKSWKLPRKEDRPVTQAALRAWIQRSRYSPHPALQPPARFTLTMLQKEIASMGGKASSGSFEKGSEAAKEAGKKGGSAS